MLASMEFPSTSTLAFQFYHVHQYIIKYYLDILHNTETNVTTLTWQWSFKAFSQLEFLVVWKDPCKETEKELYALHDLNLQEDMFVEDW